MDSLPEVLDAWFSARMDTIHTALPGIVREYDTETRRATVQPGVTVFTSIGDSIEIPPIQNVPMVFPSGGGASIRFPVSVGDSVLLVFSEAGIGDWLADGTILTDADDACRF